MLDRTTRANLLYDFYGTLLSEKQREFFELYYHDDWSLGEIAEKYQVSRQGVYDNIKRSEKALEDFESKLGLYNAHCNKEKIYIQIRTLIEASELKNDIKKQVKQLIEELQMND
ncbi:putative DNA-binding protein [Desulfuribacillus alkaliarsenatis]|uniref:UPF0122 protein BHF68_02570 n=1 Tax=Desulfuribacillus alkaliarsenatis TaxID=766136 RepID=A0A1E5G5T7_9FIRM|nr:putative DNA-binding protein [Desulfuribacillus alkaliarsenatis]OEF98567.1 hypothetical protein BHF68_02570 [Desulfuribacillus alkaliarsenatis]